MAGCAAASTALERGLRVAVLEAGPAGPLPEALRSPDLTAAGRIAEWWWPGPYPAGRGVGGGSAVNGMILQRPVASDPAAAGLADELEWAWTAYAPEPIEPGPLTRRLTAVVRGSTRWTPESVGLALRQGRRLTAADVWLTPRPGLTVVGRRLVTPQEVGDWAQDRLVVVAAGALASPRLVGVEPRPALDHRAAVVSFDLVEELRCGDRRRPAASAMLRAGDVQVLVMDHTGGDRSGGAVVVMALVEDPDGGIVEAGVTAAVELLADVGIEGRVEPGPAPVAHACATLRGLATPVPVIDAATLPGLPAVAPMVTVAAHARRSMLEILSSRW